ncbi:MAG: ABC transporter ATP-binding protein [Chloroflexi bacterium]|nr:ABC transporter ATP-binding protein [Chloroflexota bacterium]
MAREPAIVVEGLVKRYGRFTALDGVSFSVERGSIYGFIGPNGAGKTTALRILATLMLPTEGRAWVAGADLLGSPRDVRRHIGYMPDFFGVYDDLTVWEYLEFYAQANGLPRDRWRRTIADLLELVDLGAKRGDYVEALSRGMKQRLGLARCLVHDPDVLLLDEPASGLDPRARVELREVLRELPRMGKTVLISSHILPELADVSTQVGILHGGRMVASGSVDEIQVQLGTSRVLEVRVLGDAENAARVLEGLPGVGGVDVAEGLVRASFTGGLDGQAAALRALVEAGIEVVSFNAAGGLEELFMALTEEETGE